MDEKQYICPKNISRSSFNQAMTLVELLVVVGIFSIVVLGLIQTFIVGTKLSELSDLKTIAFGELQDKMEEIRSHTYSAISTDYASGGTPGNKFDLSQITGKGVITIDSSTPSLLKIDIVASFRDKSRRVVGEDKNLNGVLDAGEDADGNGVLDAPIKLSTYLRSS